MATWQHLRSSTANKRPTTSLADGRIAINTNTASPGLFFTDSAGTGIVKVGPVHVGTTPPNSSPAVGGSTGNYLGEQWLDTSVSPAQLKVWNGSTWVGVVADELPVSKLQDGEPRQLIQTDAAGTGVEWTSNIDIPGTLDVTSTATFDSIASHPLGSAAAPTITFTGDTNTGVYSPGADQVAISTGGSGRLFVDSSGRVGVGTSSPGQILTANGALQATSNSSSFDQQGIQFDYFDGGSIGRIAAYKSTGSSIGFFTNSSGGNATERARIDSTGRVGIGTSSPSAGLTVALGNSSIPAAGATGAAALFSNSVALNTYGLILGAATTGAGYIQAQRADGTATTYDLHLQPNGGRVGIGTTSPGSELDVRGLGRFYANSSGLSLDNIGRSADNISIIRFLNNAVSTELGRVAHYGNDLDVRNLTANSLTFGTNNTERARIDSSGRLLVGTSSARTNFFNAGNTSQFQVEGNGEMSAIRNLSTDPFGAMLLLGKSRSTGNTVVQNNDTVALLTFQGNDGSEFVECATIKGEIDGTPGANDMPGRLVFSTTADGASSPTERVRITQAGYTKITSDATFVSGAGNYHEIRQHTTDATFIVSSKNASYATDAVVINIHRAANSAYHFLSCKSGDYADNEFMLRGDGQAYADGSWNGGGADYAEYFEWADSNPDSEDRRGISVVLDGDKIREAQAGEDPIGVISGNPSVVGDSAWNKWNGKYLRDEFGTYILEDYEVEDEDGNTVIQQRRKLNPAYDPDVEYISREERPEWDCVGLMGKLRIRKGQVTGSRWIKMRDISDSVEEWLVR